MFIYFIRFEIFERSGKKNNIYIYKTPFIIIFFFISVWFSSPKIEHTHIPSIGKLIINSANTPINSFSRLKVNKSRPNLLHHLTRNYRQQKKKKYILLLIFFKKILFKISNFQVRRKFYRTDLWPLFVLGYLYF